MLASGHSESILAQICDRHPKTIKSWLKETTRFDKTSADKIASLAKISIPKHVTFLDEYAHNIAAGKLGWQRRTELYGNPGTQAGRALGGARAIITNKRLGNAFKTRMKILKPLKNSSLAEFVGILLGDGGITKYQVHISLNRTSDADYANYVTKLGQKLFGLKPLRQYRDNCVIITFSSIELVDFLVSIGLRRGHKVRQQVTVPAWILGSSTLSWACVRGLIDTDGCVYIDHHQIAGRDYKQFCLSFSNASHPLLEMVLKTLQDQGLEARIYSRNVKLRAYDEVKRYFHIIGSSNPKHLNKFRNYSGKVA